MIYGEHLPDHARFSLLIRKRFCLLFAHMRCGTIGRLASVYTEKIMKASNEMTGRTDSIHWQNMQLYAFGSFFAAWSVYAGSAEMLKERGVSCLPLLLCCCCCCCYSFVVCLSTSAISWQRQDVCFTPPPLDRVEHTCFMMAYFGTSPCGAVELRL